MAGLSADRGPPARGADLSALLAPAVDGWIDFELGRSLDDALARARAAHALAGVDAAALRDVLSTAVRRRATALWIRDALVSRPAPPKVAALLAVCLSQLLAGSYGDHVLVDQAVGHARREGGAGAGGFVNGVLRAFLRRRADLGEEAIRDPARRANLPAWWYGRMTGDLGAQAGGVLAAQQREPPQVLRVNRRRATVAGVLASLATAGIEARPLGRDAILLGRPLPVDRIPGFASGELSVQDAGAQLAAPWLDARGEMRVLDACAAPGGKTAHLLECSDCHVDAVESDPVRAARIAPGLARLGLESGRVAIHTADVCTPPSWWNGRPYERILLDAPCTGSGVVSRHPDIPWLRRSADVAKSATMQGKMLDSLWPLLAPAGRLLYVVCSVFPEEGSRQIESFLQREPRARPVRLAGTGPAQLLLLPGGGVLACPGEPTGGFELPSVHDGFFFALLEKT